MRVILIMMIKKSNTSKSTSEEETSLESFKKGKIDWSSSEDPKRKQQSNKNKK